MIPGLDIEGAIRKEEKDEEHSTAQVRIKKTQHSALLRVFIDSMNDYQLAQSDYRDRCKGRIKRQLEISMTNYSMPSISLRVTSHFQN